MINPINPNGPELRDCGGCGEFMLEVKPLDREAGFRAAAHDFLKGLTILCESETQPMHSTLLLASFGIECALKSFLSGQGIGEKLLKDEYGHNLERLWIEAANLGLEVSNVVPDWLKLIHRQNQPAQYHIRYMKFPATISPRAEVIRDGLKALIEAAGRPPIFRSAE